MFKGDKLSSQVSTAKPGEITGFGYIGGSVYKSITFSDNLSDSTIKKNYFAEQLLAGVYDLFAYPKNDQQVFVVRKENNYYLLTNTSYMGSGEINEPGNYQSQLLFLSVPCKTPLNDIERISFNEKNIVKFITELNHCVSPEKSFISYYHKDKSKFEVMAFAGAFPANSSFQICSEVMARLSYPKVNRNVYFIVGVHYSQTPYIYYARTPGYSIYKINTTDALLSVPFTLQYNFTSGRIQPYLGVGFSVGVMKETNSDYKGQTKYSKFRLSGVGEIGIEARLISQLFIKAAWRYEGYFEYPVLGIAYKFR